MSELRRFALEEGSDLINLVAGLEQRAPFEREPDRVVERTVYDTFDWRLHDEGTRARARAGGAGPAGPRRARRRAWRLRGWSGGRSRRARCSVGWRSTTCRRSLRTCPPGPTTDRLAAIVEMRALRPLVTFRSEQSPCACSTTRARPRLGCWSSRRRCWRRHRVHARPPRVPVPRDGYEPARGRARRLPRSIPGRGACRCGATPAPPSGSPTCWPPRSCCARSTVTSSTRRWTASASRPGDYTSKLKLRLDPASTALDAVVTVLRALLATMLVNEPGTRADVDSEFLHDYRVAVRRSRARCWAWPRAWSRRRCSTTSAPSSSGSATSPRPPATSTSTCSPIPTSRRRCPSASARPRPAAVVPRRAPGPRPGRAGRRARLVPLRGAARPLPGLARRPDRAGGGRSRARPRRRSLRPPSSPRRAPGRPTGAW